MSWSDFEYFEEHNELDKLSQEEQEIAQLGLALARNDVESFTNLLATPGKQYIKAVDEHGDTLIHRAIKLDKHEIFDLLLETDDLPLNVKNREGCTPLTYAVWHRKENFAEKLVMNGADLQIRTNQDEAIALNYAIQSYLPNVTKLMITRGVNVNTQSEHNCTPLMTLCECVYYEPWNEIREEILNMLLESGANVFSKNVYGYTAFDIASRKNRDRAVIILFPHMIKLGKFNILISTIFFLMKMKSPILPELHTYIHTYLDAFSLSGWPPKIKP